MVGACNHWYDYQSPVRVISTPEMASKPRVELAGRTRDPDPHATSNFDRGRGHRSAVLLPAPGWLGAVGSHRQVRLHRGELDVHGRLPAQVRRTRPRRTTGGHRAQPDPRGPPPVSGSAGHRDRQRGRRAPSGYWARIVGVVHGGYAASAPCSPSSAALNATRLRRRRVMSRSADPR